ncbi:PH domain-containing protein [Alkalicoccobacillus porphyridii]|uniref:PH domain-containing protein n=1 Tax=Alkalicoccobacillus porphyridii TaxID=2597270 RepID=A0A554A1P0_9BACI|nr:PH domain-containing protein [Alkalicoccobacillus porphyridii]TSB47595.1 PH domain-containing protein [Alkalicoccobacillus porphyridii]
MLQQTIPFPEETISKKAVYVWRISSTLSHAITLLILAAILFMQTYYEWVSWIGTITYVIAGYVLLQAIYKVCIYPVYMQRAWRYRIDPEYLQLKYGALEHVHVLVPMVKVLHVSTTQGPILRRFGLATIMIGTTASNHEIPALPIKVAEELRGKIAILAKVNEHES